MSKTFCQSCNQGTVARKNPPSGCGAVVLIMILIVVIIFFAPLYSSVENVLGLLMLVFCFLAVFIIRFLWIQMTVDFSDVCSHCNTQYKKKK